MQLLSINVGLPKEVSYQGKSVVTGIFKDPVEGPIKVGKLNLEGDGQADLTVHGGEDKAVYVYPTEHYKFWRDTYPQKEFSFGVFGENLSATGLVETEVSIGDQYRIGSAEFMVTSPRMPCYKLGIKMEDPSFIKAFLKANYSGFYLRVLKEGVIEAGQNIEKVSEDGHQLTVAEVAGLYALDRDNLALLEKAVAAPNLPNDWKTHYKKRLTQLT
ncbi:MAG: MOSC domain-containing protein [Cyclobacteriaceae bacterium]